MQEIKNSSTYEKNYLKNNLHRKFRFVENVFDMKKLKPEIELCILQTGFDKSDMKIIKKNKDKHPEVEFWICSNNLSKDNIIQANKVGIKTVISSPFNNKMVEEFFNKINKDFYTNKIKSSDYDYSCIANAKVMIVDDNLMNVELLEEILSSFSLKTSCFLKPKEACKVISSEKFDLFLLDVMMPEMSGFELAKKIKDNPLNQNVPIVFISAISDSHNKIKGYDLGSFAYIEKPFDINIVKSQIFNILKTQKAQEVIAMNKESYIATIAHDLKTPISAGINALNLLLNQNLGELEDSQHELVEDILNSTKFMQEMVENILCKSKIESNNIDLLKQVCPLKKLVEHCIELTKYILVQKKQSIKLSCEVTETLLPLDFLEMKRAMHNLIVNASEYSPVGGKILINIFQRGNNLGVSVQDFGRGIELENQKDVFYQYMSFAKKYKKIGTGLGLYITKKIIEAHDGEINLESELGLGTKITILLPMCSKIE